MAIDLKTETPDTTIDDSAVLFGADSQSAASPSVYPVSALRDHIEASANVFTTAQTIQPLTDAPALTVRRNGGSQTSNVFQVQTEANAFLAGFDKDGKITAPGFVGSGYSLTGSASASFVDLSGTWNTTGTPTALKLNITDTASNASSALMDLQVGGASKFRVRKNGALTLAGTSTDWLIDGNQSAGYLAFAGPVGAIRFAVNWSGQFVLSSDYALAWSAGNALQTPNLFLGRRAAANLRLGAADAAAPVAQTLSVQSVSAGTADTAGQIFTIAGSQSTGSAGGGTVRIQLSPGGEAGTNQNALVTTHTFSVFSTERTLTWNGTNNDNTFRIRTDLNTSTLIFGNTIDGNYAFCGFSGSNGKRFGLLSDTYFCFVSGGLNASPDVRLYRDDAAALAQRNDNNGQTFRVYGRYTSSTNHERFFISAPTTSGAAVQLGTQKGSGGGAARALELQTDGTTRLTISATGVVSIGTPSALTSSGGYGLTVSSAALSNVISSEFTGADGEFSGGRIILVQNSGSATTSGARLGSFQFGGNQNGVLNSTALVAAYASENWSGTAVGTRFEFHTVANGQTTRTAKLIIGNSGIITFGATEANTAPALKPSSTTLQARLADDSAFATIQGKLRADVNAVAETPTATHTITITDAAGTAYKVLCVAA
jgi:hypothetical protein